MSSEFDDLFRSMPTVEAGLSDVSSVWRGEVRYAPTVRVLEHQHYVVHCHPVLRVKAQATAWVAQEAGRQVTFWVKVNPALGETQWQIHGPYSSKPGILYLLPAFKGEPLVDSNS